MLIADSETEVIMRKVKQTKVNVKKAKFSRLGLSDFVKVKDNKR
jgi:hypothetical protein